MSSTVAAGETQITALLVPQKIESSLEKALLKTASLKFEFANTKQKRERREEAKVELCATWSTTAVHRGFVLRKHVHGAAASSGGASPSPSRPPPSPGRPVAASKQASKQRDPPRARNPSSRSPFFLPFLSTVVQPLADPAFSALSFRGYSRL